MGTLLFQSVEILYPGSSFSGIADVLMKDGKIEKVSKKIKDAGAGAEIIKAKGKYLSPGFLDLNVNFGEPGLETKEDIITGCRAAAAGGFTGVALMPNTFPPIHSKSEVAYLLNKVKGNLVNIYPLGAISHHLQGKELAEMYDMHLAGAMAFTDGSRPVEDAGLMSRAMLYAKGFDATVFSFAEDVSIAAKGRMNEGVMSTYLGMKGNPAMAEELMVARDLYLAEYNETRIHFSTISTGGSAGLIRQAKKKGVAVTCDVAAHHLVLTDEQLSGFDTNFKLRPPLRTKPDVEVLIAGLKDGTIDAVVSQHTPHEIEYKNVEFETAAYGIIGLQTAFSLAVQAGLSPEMIVEKMAVNPRKIAGLPLPTLRSGEPADFVLFDTDTEWVYSPELNYSKSSNSPFINKKLIGKIHAVCNNNCYFQTK